MSELTNDIIPGSCCSVCHKSLHHDGGTDHYTLIHTYINHGPLLPTGLIDPSVLFIAPEMQVWFCGGECLLAWVREHIWPDVRGSQ